MNKNNWIIIFLALFPFGLLLADVPHGFRYKQNALSIAVNVPPAIVYVENSLGERAGVDPSSPLNDDGTQGNGGDSGLTEIPLSHVLQMNQPVFDGTDYGPRPDTTWNIDIYDSAPQTYLINLKGVRFGDATVSASGIYIKTRKTTDTEFNVLMTPGQLRQIKLAFDPIQKSIFYQRIVANGDLLTDVKTACKLNLITSDRVCDRLEKKAKTLQDALEDKRFEEAEGLVWGFLHSLGDSRPEGCKDDDDHSAIQEPALTILKEDAKALLAQIEQEEKQHPHGGNKY